MDSVISSGGPEKQDIPAGPEEAPQAAGGVINPVDAAQTASLLRQHVGGITLTYLLTLAENVVRLAYPLVIGMTIDALLKGQTWWVLAVVGVWLLHLLIGLTRHLYDTHVFTRTYSDLVQRTVAAQRQAQVPPEVIAARVALSREVVEFFEFGVPALATAGIGLVGSAFMLVLHDAVIGAMLCAVLLPVLGIFLWFGNRSLRLHHLLNNQMEREIGVVTRRPLHSVALHLQRLRAWRLRISVGEATTFGVVNLCSLALCAGLLLRLSTEPGVTPGTIYTVLAYALEFCTALALMPHVVQQAVQVRDIWKRLTT